MSAALLRGYSLLAALATIAHPSPADVVKVREIGLSPGRPGAATFHADLNPGTTFATAVSASGDFLSLVAKETGNWELYRVRNWLLESPSQEELILPGFFSKKDRSNLERLVPYVFLSSDGAYAVCAAHGQWRNSLYSRNRETLRGEDVVSAVNLATFKRVATVRTRDLGLFPVRNIEIDREDYILIGSVKMDGLNGPAWNAFVRLALPSLSPGPLCRYRTVWYSAAEKRSEPAAECQAALGASNRFEEYLRTELEPKPDSNAGRAVCKDNPALFCRLRGEYTDDGRFGVGRWSKTYELMDFDIETRRSLVVFSVAKRSDIGEIRLSAGRSESFQFAYEGGRYYLLVVEDGTLLTVYELRD